MQIKPLVASEALTFDYDVVYWVYRLSGLELSDCCAGSTRSAVGCGALRGNSFSI